MGRRFDIPIFYRSSIISRLKASRREADLRKKDLSPSVLNLGTIEFKIARHFGFCFGVENAIETAFRALKENPERRVFLLSEMIHNPQVNQDLLDRGVRFLLSTDGSQLIPFEELTPEDIVIVPAFGTTVELFERLRALGINPALYDATCPFVEKVWTRAEQLGSRGYSVVIHGKHYHEETRATFSHAKLNAPSLVIRDMREAQMLARYIDGSAPAAQFYEEFRDRFSLGFDPEKHLTRIGVVNQTTMLAGDTLSIAAHLREVMRARYGDDQLQEHFADTRDTLCYATSENQQATHGLVESGGDIAIVVGGYNSSNTSHLAEICEQNLPTFYIKDADEILSRDKIRHLDRRTHQVIESEGWAVPKNGKLSILFTAGASCPDALVDQVLQRVSSLFAEERALHDALDGYLGSLPASPQSATSGASAK